MLRLGADRRRGRPQPRVLRQARDRRLRNRRGRRDRSDAHTLPGPRRPRRPVRLRDGQLPDRHPPPPAHHAPPHARRAVQLRWVQRSHEPGSHRGAAAHPRAFLGVHRHRAQRAHRTVAPLTAVIPRVPSAAVIQADRQTRDPAPGAARPPRVLILTTDIGEGHDLPARQLALAIAAEAPGAEIRIEDGLEHMGRILTGVLKENSRAVFTAPPWLFDLQHWLAIRFAPPSALAQFFSVTLGGRGLLRLVREYRPDVVVSTYPGCTLTLAPLRRRGYMRVPLVSAITDLSQLRYWAWPGVGLHLITHPESAAEVREIAGQGARVRCVRGLTSPGFTDPPDREAGRRGLGLPAGPPVVVVSGGGWAVGDLDSAVHEGLAADPAAHVVVLCGRNG